MDQHAINIQFLKFSMQCETIKPKFLRFQKFNRHYTGGTIKLNCTHSKHFLQLFLAIRWRHVNNEWNLNPAALIRVTFPCICTDTDIFLTWKLTQLYSSCIFLLYILLSETCCGQQYCDLDGISIIIKRFQSLHDRCWRDISAWREKVAENVWNEYIKALSCILYDAFELLKVIGCTSNHFWTYHCMLEVRHWILLYAAPNLLVVHSPVANLVLLFYREGRHHHLIVRNSEARALRKPLCFHCLVSNTCCTFRQQNMIQFL